MAVTYGFYNALNHDRLYDAIQMSSIFDGIIRDGIFSTIGNTMIVTAPEDGMYVNVGSGRAWFNHTWTLNDTAYPIEAEEAEVVLDRIDAVILEVNSSAEVRANSIKFLKGTPSSNPVKPTLTHNAEVNQYALAYVRIRAGQTTIFQSDIENAVGTDETPFITGVLQQVSIETLLKQWEAEFNTYFTNFQNTSTTEFNNWFAAKVSEYTAWFAQMQTDMDSNFNEFDAWFQRMKDQLDENQAGHLQLQIDTLNSDINALEAEMPFAGGSKVNINFEYDVVPNIQYSNEHYKLTVGDTVRENNFSSSNLHFNEYGILTVGDGVLEVTYDITDLRTGRITPASYTYTINMPYFGRFAYNVTISVASYNYEGWLESIGKDPSQYSTIEDVFADEKLLRELMTRHASVDYLVEWLANNNEDAHTVLNNDYCAKWINLRDYALDMLYANSTVKAVMDEVDKYGYGEWALVGQVPTLTSNTGRNGEASASGVYGSYKIYSAFDNDASTEWFSETGTSEHYIQYKFNTPILIDKVNIKAGAGQGKPSKFTIDVSTDGNEFITLKEILSSDWADGVSYDISLDNDTPYLCYRVTLKELSTTSSSSSIREFQLYAWQPKGLAPVMTSNTAPYGEASADTVYGSGYEAFRAFDGSETSNWSASNNGSAGLNFKFTNPVNVKRFKIRSYNATTWELYYSNDGSNWTSTNAKITVSIAGSILYADVNTDVYALYWRVKATTTSSAIYTLQFYGRQLNVSVPKMTSNTAPFGEVISESENSSYPVKQAFDRNESTYGLCNSFNVSSYIGYRFNRKVCVKVVSQYPNGNSSSSLVKGVILEGSNNGTTWEEITAYTLANSRTLSTNAIDNNNGYTYYRLRCDGTSYVSSPSDYGFTILQFYGLDYSEREFGEGSTMKYLYDHGVELEPIDGFSTNSSSAFYAKEPNQLYVNKTANGVLSLFNTANGIDISPYKLLRGIAGDKFSYTGGNVDISIRSAHNDASQAISQNILSSNFNQLPNNIFLDASSINSVAYPVMTTNGGGTVNSMSLTEWWLE